MLVLIVPQLVFLFARLGDSIGLGAGLQPRHVASLGRGGWAAHAWASPREGGNISFFDVAGIAFGADGGCLAGWHIAC